MPTEHRVTYQLEGFTLEGVQAGHQPSRMGYRAVCSCGNQVAVSVPVTWGVAVLSLESGRELARARRLARYGCWRLCRGETLGEGWSDTEPVDLFPRPDLVALPEGSIDASRFEDISKLRR